MLAFLKRPLIIASAGLLLLSLFIWYAGPLIAIGKNGYQPLGSEIARLVAIIAVIAWWGAVQWLKRRRARRAGSQLAAAVVNQAGAEQPNADAVRLREQFEEAIRTLKQNRKGAHSLYELPWYVIIGAPGSGKTTALVNSGLHFPLEQRVGRGALRGVGGTRNCDWWFTDEAIFLDTAGRYTTQDSDAASDSAGWTEFLSLLKKYRGRRPINGIILAISAHDLMIEGEHEREAHVAAVRRRLDELNRELRVQLPVYLMVTKCDLLAGFSEYFDDLAQDGRAQVWGVTFPYEQSVSGQAPAAFPVEFDALISRANERVFGRVDEERDARRRPRIFGFPQQVAALRGSLSDFVASTFASTRFDRALLLRGVYFTSGTQEGTPIDRLLGAMGRRFGVAGEVVGTGGKGKAYFIEHLLKHVLVPESGLAGVSLRREAAQAAAQLGAYVAVAVVAIAGVLVLANSYRNNRAFIHGVEAPVKQAGQTPLASTGAPVDRVLRRLDAVNAVVGAADVFRGETSWWGRGWGLDQSGTVRGHAWSVYANDLDLTLVPLLRTRLEQGMREYAAEPDAQYMYLKAYLMLDPKPPVKFNASHLQQVAAFEWTKYASDAQAAQRLGAHFDRLLESGGVAGVDLDMPLIAQTRSAMRQASIPRLIYGSLKTSYDLPARALRLDERIGSGDLFVRKSGIPLKRPVDAIFTKGVFEEIAGKSTKELVDYFEEDSWVWGDEQPISHDSAALAPQVLEIYERDYISYWDALLMDITLAPLPTLARTKQALTLLSGGSSPLRALLQVVQENTLLTKPETPAAADGDSGFRDTVLKRLRGSVPVAVQQVKPGAQITAHFAPIHRLLNGEAGSSALDRLIAQIKEIQQTLAPVGGGVGEKPADDPATMAAIKQGADSLKAEATGLPPAVGNIVTELGARAVAVTSAGLKTIVANTYRQEVLSECRELIGTKYPFGQNMDVSVADFTSVFGPNGAYAKFRRAQQQLIDDSRATWVWREGSGGGVPLEKFQAVERIQQIFFQGGGSTPEVAFTLTPESVSSDRLVLELDGQPPRVYQNNAPPPWEIKWPGKRAGKVVLTFEDRSGGGPHLEFGGAWAVFKLIESAAIRAESDESFLLTFQAGGKNAKVRLTADSSRNPWSMMEWRKFQCG